MAKIPPGVGPKFPHVVVIFGATGDPPAAEVGIEAGDLIGAVDGVSASSLSGWDFRRTVRKPPPTHVKLARKKRQLIVTLRELLS